jgi:predicted secreted protein
MTITAALVVYSVTWFLTFFVVIQLRTVTQSDIDHVEPGTPPGAPAHEVVGRMARIATLWATVIWAAICGVILSGWITVEDIDVFGRMSR